MHLNEHVFHNCFHGLIRNDPFTSDYYRFIYPTRHWLANPGVGAGLFADKVAVYWGIIC